ncbi:TPA: hypothetical protein DEB72_01580 [Patescibacteria group bacterium]|nr:hypothetical protein [Patescibacteria group bacterium]
MPKENLEKLVKEIVKDASDLKDKYISQKKAPVNYACVFAQSDAEYKDLSEAVKTVGQVVKETKSGFLYHINDLETDSGRLQLLKIRIPDATRPERGDADFTVTNYESFKNTYLSKPGFKLIPRENFEMMELMDRGFNVRAYFSNPPLDEQLGLK